MTCAVVLYIDGPFEQVDDDLGLTKAAEIRMASAAPQQDILVLITQGFDKIPPSAVARLAELRYRLVDASAELAAVRQRHAFANAQHVWRGNLFHEACFLRWLVLETYFGSTPILSMDSDIVWRVDPFTLLERWKEGGSFLCFKSCCLTFIHNGDWYEIYKSGLARLAADPNFGSDFDHTSLTSLYHDQALFQYLEQLGELKPDRENFFGHGLAEQYYFQHNPLRLEPAEGAPPLTFERTGTVERVAGRIVPFWHMQTTFTRYLFLAYFLPLFAGRKEVRIPFDPGDQGDADPKLVALNNIRYFLKQGQITLHHPRHRHLHALTRRTKLYSEFFEGNLASNLFRDKIWWRPGIWAQ